MAERVGARRSRAYVGLGSNLGDRIQNLHRALALLEGAPGIAVAAVSAFYETPPWGFREQTPFVNAVAALDTSLGPRQLLVALKSFEVRVGRRPTFHWGPRVVDLDLLLFGELTLNRRGLTLPHPAMLDRAFVLVPLADVFPGFRSPTGRSLAELICGLDLTGIRRI